MDKDGMKSKVLGAANKIMEDSRMIRLPGHNTRHGDEGLWKENCSWKIDCGKTSVKWCKCPMSYRTVASAKSRFAMASTTWPWTFAVQTISSLPCSNNHAVVLAGADISPAIRTDHDSDSDRVMDPDEQRDYADQGRSDSEIWMETLRFLLIF